MKELPPPVTDIDFDIIQQFDYKNNMITDKEKGRVTKGQE
jgi:hypothetical protein